jgi:hypothetical protein
VVKFTALVSRNEIEVLDVFRLIAMLVVFSVLLSAMGYRGWLLMGYAIIFGGFMKTRKLNLSRQLLVLLGLFVGVFGKKLLSSVPLEDLLKLGAQGDYIDVWGVILATESEMSLSKVKHLFTYVVSFSPIGIRHSLGLENVTDILNGIVWSDYVDVSMGFNVSTFHALYYAFGFFGLIFIPVIAYLVIRISKLINSGRFSPSFLPVLISTTLVFFNMGSFKYVFFFIVIWFVTQTLRLLSTPFLKLKY